MSQFGNTLANTMQLSSNAHTAKRNADGVSFPYILIVEDEENLYFVAFPSTKKLIEYTEAEFKNQFTIA